MIKEQTALKVLTILILHTLLQRWLQMVKLHLAF